MKNYIYLLSLSIFFLACGEPKMQKEINVEESVKQIENTIAIEVEIEEKEFNSIEDYGTIKNKQQLINEFGEENLIEDTSWYAEGEVMKLSTSLINPKNKHVIKYIWEDDNKTTGWIEAYYYVRSKDYNVLSTQKIETACGVYLGMPLNDLREWNGVDFRFSGFGWDYAGHVFPDSASKLAVCPVGIELSMEHSEGDEFNELWGDIELRADDENVQNAPIIIDKLTLYLEQEK
jgi:hypothetical protein